MAIKQLVTNYPAAGRLSALTAPAFSSCRHQARRLLIGGESCGGAGRLDGLLVSLTRGEGLARLISRALTVFSISVETEVLTVTWCHTTTLWPCFLSPADQRHQPTLPSTPPTATPTTSTSMTRTQTSSSTQASPQSLVLEEVPGPRHTGPRSSRGPAGTMSGV